jgi:tetratricopeptide (TPR) repeat protein
MKAECLFRLEKYQEAWPAYQVATKTKASTPAIAVLTLLHGGQTASQLKQWAEAQKLLAEIPAKHPETPLLPDALYELGWAKQNAGQADEALKDYEAAASKSRDHVGARARFMMGEVYFEQKKYDEAGREFQRAMFGFGGDQATAETKNWQAKSGFEAGRVAEIQIAAKKDAARKKLIADARRFYTFVVEKHASHELASEAKKRLEELSKL